MIRDAKSPTLVREMLLAYLPEKHRHAEAETTRPPSRRRPERRRAATVMAKKKAGGHGGGGHGWFVTFADLMGLLVASS